jgi:hypothetical protein
MVQTPRLTRWITTLGIMISVMGVAAGVVGVVYARLQYNISEDERERRVTAERAAEEQRKQNEIERKVAEEQYRKWQELTQQDYRKWQELSAQLQSQFGQVLEANGRLQDRINKIEEASRESQIFYDSVNSGIAESKARPQQSLEAAEKIIRGRDELRNKVKEAGELLSSLPDKLDNIFDEIDAARKAPVDDKALRNLIDKLGQQWNVRKSDIGATLELARTKLGCRQAENRSF